MIMRGTEIRSEDSVSLCSYSVTDLHLGYTTDNSVGIDKWHT